MARRKTHKFSVRTLGMTNEQAAQLHYLIACAAEALAEEHQSCSNVPVRTLRELFPNEDWGRATTQERVALVT